MPVVSYTNTYDSGAGNWKYESTIINDTPDLLYDFVVYPTVEPTDGADLTGQGWGFAEIGNISPYFVHWMSDIGTEIIPSETMGGFWFTYNGGASDYISSLSYTVTLWDLVNDQPYTYDGFIVGSTTTTVPEPGTLALVSIGIFCLTIILLRRTSEGTNI